MFHESYLLVTKYYFTEVREELMLLIRYSADLNFEMAIRWKITARLRELVKVLFASHFIVTDNKN